jgi:hypothetical protein
LIGTHWELEMNMWFVAICEGMDDGKRPWLVCLMLSSRNVVWNIVDHGNNGASQGAFRGNKRTHEGVDVVVAECSNLGTAKFWIYLLTLEDAG